MKLLQASVQKYILNFKRPAGTSRGVYSEKETWFIFLKDDSGKVGIGECGILKGLSCDDRPGFIEQIELIAKDPTSFLLDYHESLKTWPAIRFGFEMALISLAAQDPFLLFPSSFTQGTHSIPINALIWMGEQAYMRKQIEAKLQDKPLCVKMKIGAIDFNQELDLIRAIRKRYSSHDVEIRVDANGGFAPDEALEKLTVLSDLQIHSIEQPIQTQQWQEMATLIKQSPLPIALDEELIGVNEWAEKANLLSELKPHYIILKPSLLGGFRASEEWLTLANQMGIPWWATSALESNIGLNAIAQWVVTQNNPLVQGLGTGSLYDNNIESPLFIEQMTLNYNPEAKWDTSKLSI